ncbi:hypothetical protein OG874_00240 [Nocardia sp. NBC_00565]|uniref:hypothetical protein n=1 Tax=Nocardia sp. NBC_00565 TaxID=2975993 RepID=UPI002E811BF5|nr:hypothetical protein [Nocardia sp. NBC_00565]WUC03683.1 hypothetical protein OG874_00240 [Nocardia sp. NBC_00565]
MFAQGVETPSPSPVVATPTAGSAALKLDGSFGGPAPHANSPAGAEYAPQLDPVACIAKLEAQLQTAREMYTSARERAAELRTELDAKKRQHAETLNYLERAYEVIEKDTAAHQRLIRALWKSRRDWQTRDIAESPGK